MVELTNRQPKAEQADNRMKCYYDIEHATRSAQILCSFPFHSFTLFLFLSQSLEMEWMTERNTIFYKCFDSDTNFLIAIAKYDILFFVSQQIVAHTNTTEIEPEKS